MIVRRRLVALAVVLVVHGAGGDWLRNLVGYPAWGAIMALTLAWIIVELVRLRPRIGAVPIELAVYVTLGLLSTIWALSPWSTFAVGGSLLVLMSASGLLLAMLPVRTLVSVLHWSLQGLLLASIAFEALAEVLPGDRIYPLVPAPGVEYGPDAPAAYAWSRGLLFQGGRIQGVMGNANLLAMVALLALIIAVARVVDASGSRRPASGPLGALGDRLWAAWLLLPIACLVLTRSSTVIVAALAVALVTALLVVRTRVARATFRRMLIGIGALGVIGAIVVATQWTLVTTLLGRDADLTGRFELWGSALGLWLQSPVLGTGYMGYWLPWIEPFDHLGMFDGVLYLQAHDVWVDHLMQLGILGVIAWAALQVRAFRSALRWSRIPSAEAAVPLLILVALFVQGFAESRPMIEIGMLLLVACCAGLSRRQLLTAGPRRLERA